MGVLVVVGIAFIYVPEPPKNVRLFVVSAVLATKKQLYTPCDKPETIVLKDGLGSQRGRIHWGILIAQTLRRDKKGCGYVLQHILLSLLEVFHSDDRSFLFKQNFSLPQHIHLGDFSPWAA